MPRSSEHSRSLSSVAPIVLAACLLAVVLGWVAFELVSQNLREQGAVTVRDAILNGARQCCAIEGSYPLTLEYLEEHYGVTVDHEDYVVTYDAFASNVMPTVVVVPR